MYTKYILARNRSNYKRIAGDETNNNIDNCRFCEMIKSGNATIMKTEDMCVMINEFPYNVGHVMVIPLRHTKDPRELSDKELVNMQKVINKMMTVIEKTYPVRDFNIGLNVGSIAGSTYEHLHIQVVPRWMGDVGFMESIADTKIIKESPRDTIRKLKETIEKNEQLVNKED